MPNSYAQTTELTCPGCGKLFETEIWLIVDTGERPDLLERIRSGVLHDVTCPHCGASGPLDAPLLLYTPTSATATRPPLLFSPASNTDEGEDQNHAHHLLDVLRQSLGNVWHDEWLRDGIPIIAFNQLSYTRVDQGNNQTEVAVQGIPPELFSLLDQLHHLTQPSDIPRRIAIYQDALSLLDRTENPSIWAAIQVELANSLLKNPLGERSDNVERAIAAYQDVLQVETREDRPVEWAITTLNLANAYRDRIRGDRAENLETAITLNEHVLQVITREAMPVEWAKTTMNLASAYYARIRGERAENLERAIQGYQHALQVMTRDAMPIDWASATSNLATAYATRIYGKRAENVEQAIALNELALQVMTREAMPIEWARTTVNLANAYYARIRSERVENQERALTLLELALQVITRETAPVEWASVTMNLANAYRDRIRGELAENQEQAIQSYKDALQVSTRETMPFDWAQTTVNLAIAYHDRIRGERGDNQEQAIQGYQDALQVLTQETMPIEWARATLNLANAYRDRIRGDRVENLERAITLNERALQVMTAEGMPVEWAKIMTNLAITYADRIRGEREENLELAIALNKRILQVVTREAIPFDWAQTTMNLANAYYARIRGERSENQELAIQAYQDALQVRTRETTPIEWAITTMNLAIAYHNRIRGRRAENQELAISAFQDALQVITREAMPVAWARTVMNLAAAYYDRIHGERLENVALAIQGYEQALTVYTLTIFPDDYRRAQQGLGTIYFNQGNWLASASALRQALAASDLQYTSIATLEARQVELHEVNGLPAACAYALAQLNVNDDTSLAEAIVTLERNRARWLTESLTLRSAQSASFPQPIWQQFTATATHIQQLQSEAQLPDKTPGKRDFLSLSALLTDARRELNDLIEQVRSHNPDFMPMPSFAEIQRTFDGVTAARGQPEIGVYLLATPAGGLALLVHAGSVTSVWLNKLTDFALRELLTRPTYGPVLGEWFGARDDLQAWQQTMDRVTQHLWDWVMGPLAVALEGLGLARSNDGQPPVITLIPMGLLALLPLHAAWCRLPPSPPPNLLQPGGGIVSSVTSDRRYFLDDYAVRYAPSTTALRHCQERTLTVPAQALLAIDEPLPINLGGALPNSAREVKAIASLFADLQVLPNKEATYTAVRNALAAAQVAHFSCHGANNWQNPLDSGLLLANDELLTVRDFLELHLPGARLATLSACETGIVGTDLPDEVIMLPSALVQAGYAGVIASLWSVADVSTALLMTRFYQEWRKNGLEPVYALRAAQRWLRDASAAELQLAQIYAEQYQASGRRDRNAFNAQRYYEAHPKEHPFYHPFWWGAFYLTGV